MKLYDKRNDKKEISYALLRRRILAWKSLDY